MRRRPHNRPHPLINPYPHPPLQRLDRLNNPHHHNPQPRIPPQLAPLSQKPTPLAPKHGFLHHPAPPRTRNVVFRRTLPPLPNRLPNPPFPKPLKKRLLQRPLRRRGLFHVRPVYPHPAPNSLVGQNLQHRYIGRNPPLLFRHRQRHNVNHVPRLNRHKQPLKHHHRPLAPVVRRTFAVPPLRKPPLVRKRNVYPYPLVNRVNAPPTPPPHRQGRRLPQIDTGLNNPRPLPPPIPNPFPRRRHP